MQHIKYTIDSDGIAFITWDVANSPVNIMNQETMNEFFTTVTRSVNDSAVKGIVINSAKQDFIAGGDLKWFLNYDKSREECFDMLMETHKAMRLLETSGKPVVAAMNGLALGGGVEIALACHHRIMVNHPKNKMGLVECSVGLFPGAGGTQRYLRMLGAQKTIEFITQSKKLTAEQALHNKLVNQICEPTDDINKLAKQWILDNPNACQPWDDKHFVVPGTPNGVGQMSGITEFYSVSNAMAYKTTHGNMPHIKNVLSAIYHGGSTSIDNALEIEARYFVDTLFSKETKNIIRSSFIFIGDAAKGKAKPKGFERASYKKVGVLGAGMMGAGIAYVTAKAGIEVALKDVSIESSERGKSYSEKIEQKKLAKGRTTEIKMNALLEKIKPTDKVEDLADCDLIIEAVFENEKLKNSVTKETEAIIKPEVIYASNTSTIPITTLAKASVKPDKYIGLHFFSPVDKMPLVEVIVGKETSDETLAAAIDYVTKIKKVPIVVNDGRGFFTSRVFGKFVNEGIAMLSQGLPPAVIENVAKKIGMPVGPLAVSDEVNLKLMLDIMGEDPTLSDFEKKLEKTIYDITTIHKRTGKKEGAGFYEYPKEGRKYIWENWKTIFPVKEEYDEEEIGKRLLFAMVIDSYKCLESGVLKEPKDADIGSILGLGFPIYTGGVMSYIDYIGANEFLAYSEKLARKHGERFKLPESLKEKISKAENNRIFYKN
ncbi:MULTISPECIES: 3-hydroxyacyl-CoA dehydrogenase NAD-binding domain-containing protein [unclassified Tenacibaculum]|uniref:3-hydroxyacyl-CoA dehydrogenase NAD-binding domain-containing protein n=1 Tax=unclassified Tenacibaculum TaxID=2635139 RepID=UPI001F350CCB|nr:MULTISPECIES: 3-hydroxyacyl-CoA dehydrogenase NAD-binding domain-containing protein [unclassified Tenacibaculum]MCF2876459.1 3-hydroxyacyl-CoA dehydrogenase NAD-binding domain-containing protein [Tenacibaculum sp. Cn5-1]MCF2936634.1 3-hydroxyacyl-CoA dehydrogenase NAD-binding domain-containing protein [Tenacibaculum sp. Cn5-34]MCG7511773.1 3-hydroxyacyl-CoA dehydrogenase NAD-binding domain-containing protein [Tenacibaculum sp. Cn5-46]